jgi:hypothetical protein
MWLYKLIEYPHKRSRKESEIRDFMKITYNKKKTWNIKCTLIPVIFRATRIVTKGLKRNLKTVPRKHLIYSLQNTAILGTPHIWRKGLQSETWSLSDGDHCCFKRRSTRERRLVTRKIVISKKNKYMSVKNAGILLFWNLDTIPVQKMRNWMDLYCFLSAFFITLHAS